MSLSFPLTAPATPAPRRLLIRPTSVVGMTASPFTGEQQVQAHQGAWWELDFELPPMRRSTAAAWVGMFTALNYREGTFVMGVRPRTPLGLAGGAPLVNGAGQTGKTLVTDGWSPVTGTVKAGDFFHMGSGGSIHLYQAVQDVAANGSGQATLEIWPGLRSSPADNAPLTFTGPQGIWRLKEPFAYSIELAMLYGISATLIEAL